RAMAVLRSLHLHFLDRRLAMQDAPFEEIVRHYLFKAAHLCHGVPEEDLAAGRLDAGSPIFRSSFKHINNSSTALEITEGLSSHGGEWTEERKKIVYHTPESGIPAESLAALAFQTLRPQVTNRYQDDVAPRYRLFRDTTKHMSAPVVAGDKPGLGV